MLHSFSELELSEGITLNSYITCSNKALLLNILPSRSDSTSFPTSVNGIFLNEFTTPWGLPLSNAGPMIPRSTIQNAEQKNTESHTNAIRNDQLIRWIDTRYLVPTSE